MAELRVGGKIIAASDDTWKTHMSQVHTSHVTRHTSHLTPHTSHLTPHTSHFPPHTSHLHVAHIGTWGDGSFGGDALDDNLIVEGWDRYICQCRLCVCVCLCVCVRVLFVCFVLTIFQRVIRRQILGFRLQSRSLHGQSHRVC
jgi:hypothetical protein